MDEIWKDIVGYVGKYQVSNLGNVKRIAHYSYHPRGNGHKFFLPERMLKQDTHKKGKYHSKAVTLTKEGKGKTFLVHRLVAQAFISNPENKPQVNHIDGNPTNNIMSNLEWVSGTENMQHAIRTGLYSIEQSRKAGMTHARPVRCKETGVVYSSQSEAARCNNIDLIVVQTSVKLNRPGRCGLTFELVKSDNDNQDFSRFNHYTTREEREEY